MRDSEYDRFLDAKDRLADKGSVPPHTVRDEDVVRLALYPDSKRDVKAMPTNKRTK